MSSLARNAAVLVLFAALGFAIYGNTLDVAFYLDDTHNIIENTSIRIDSLSFANLENVVRKSPMPSRPLANISFALNYLAGGLDSRGYHYVNILIHILAGFFLYQFLGITFATPTVSPTVENRHLVALFAALIWFVHPVQTQAVTYIVQRMASMSALFFVLAMYCYARARMTHAGKWRLPWFVACVLTGILALTAKEIAVTLPLVILLYEWYFFRDCSRKFALTVAPVLLGVGMLLALYLFFINTSLIHKINHLYMYRGFSLDERLWTEIRVIVFYFSLLLFPLPTRLSFYHDFPLSQGILTPPTTLISLVLLLLLLLLAWKTANRYRLLSFGILWFFINILLESTFIPLELVFEHRLYLPSMLLFPLVPILLFKFFNGRMVTYAVLGGLVVVLSVGTIKRNSVWADPLRFLQDSVVHAESDPRTHYNLGVYYLGKQKYADAVAAFADALRLEPDYGEVHKLTGDAYYQLGKYDAAYEHYLAALKSYPSDVSLYLRMGRTLMAQNKKEAALKVFFEVIRLQPHNGEAHYLAANLLAAAGKVDEAIVQYREALAYGEQNRYNILVNMGTAFAKKGDFRQALDYYQQAFRLNPQDPLLRHNIERARSKLN